MTVTESLTSVEVEEVIGTVKDSNHQSGGGNEGDGGGVVGGGFGYSHSDASRENTNGRSGSERDPDSTGLLHSLLTSLVTPFRPILHFLAKLVPFAFRRRRKSASPVYSWRHSSSSSPHDSKDHNVETQRAPHKNSLLDNMAQNQPSPNRKPAQQTRRPGGIPQSESRARGALGSITNQYAPSPLSQSTSPRKSFVPPPPTNGDSQATSPTKSSHLNNGFSRSDSAGQQQQQQLSQPNNNPNNGNIVNPLSLINDRVSLLSLNEPEDSDVADSPRLSRLQQKLQENILLKLGGNEAAVAVVEAAAQEAVRQSKQATELYSMPVLPPNTPLDEVENPFKVAERRIHKGFMDEALKMARTALETNETPVGAVFVHEGRVIARGMNATNVTRNGTRHAELMALSALFSYKSNTEVEVKKPKKSRNKKNRSTTGNGEPEFTEQQWADVNPEDSHIFPYGQKLHPAPRVDRTILKDCTLYVTVEPCVMCASMLRQYGLKKVYFGAVNDKFGGTGGVFCIHMNSERADGPPSSPMHRPVSNQAPKPTWPARTIPDGPSAIQPVVSVSEEDKGEVSDGVSAPKLPPPPPVPTSNFSVGHGGNVEEGYEAEGGWGRDEAVHLLRLFYVQENERAPVPRKKEGRAARLAAMTGDKDLLAQVNAKEGDGSGDGTDGVGPAEDVAAVAAQQSNFKKDIASTDIPLIMETPADEARKDAQAVAAGLAVEIAV